GSAGVMRELLEFGDLTARSVMVPRVRIVGIPLGATAAEMQAILEASPHTRYPVYDGTIDRIIGMLHVKDILRCVPSCRALAREQTRPAPFVPETAEMDSVLAAMRASRSQMVIVMDEHGGTSGLITIEDLFEEVIGEIEEDAAAPAEFFRDGSGRLHVAGGVRVEEVGAALGVVLEHDEVDTVSGLVLALLGRPPGVGDVVTYDDVRFEVVAVDGRGVRECVVDPVLPLVDPTPGGR
ncbi:MAG: hemolysin family protein, partial [Gemmatimonadota bacterium]|nr:hemolysin family protein [Gemmatimonadota bacterium]